MSQLRARSLIAAILLLLLLIVQLIESVISHAEPFFPANIQNMLINSIVLYEGSPKAYVNNREITIDSSSKKITPVISGGKLLVPLRFLAESLGGKLNTNNKGAYTLSLDGNIINLKLNSSIIKVGTKEYAMDFPACTIQKRTFIPLKSFAQHLGKEMLFYKGLIIISDKKSINQLNSDKISLQKVIAFFKENHDVYIPILMYHNLDLVVNQGMGATTVTPDEFDEQIKYLVDNGYKAITFSDFNNYMAGAEKLPSKPFIITFDDGYYSNYKYAYPILQKYNTPATIFVITSYVGTSPGVNPHFTWDDARKMEASGLIEIQNHSVAHGRHDKMSKQELIASSLNAQKVIDKELGERQVKVFSYPGGRCSKESRSILKHLGFTFQITGLDKINTKSSDPTDLNRISVEHNMTGRDILKKIKLLEVKQRLNE